MGRIDAESETLIPTGGFFDGPAVAPCLTGNYGKPPDNSDTSAGPMLIAHTLRADGFDASEDGTGRGTPLVPAVAFDARQSDVLQYGEVSGPLDTYGHTMGVLAHGVRRLTPTECERLQGFPDGHTAVIYRNKPAADGPRTKAIGNSMAVPVLRWILSRIEQVEAIP